MTMQIEIILHGPKGERKVLANTPYRLLPGEKIVSSTVNGHSEIDKVAQENNIGVGDLIASITTSTGFKRWWDKLHGGECQSCKKNQATLNYIKFQGPKWLSKFVKERLT